MQISIDIDIPVLKSMDGTVERPSVLEVHNEDYNKASKQYPDDKEEDQL